MAKRKQFHQSTGRQIKVDGDAKQTEKLKMAILAKRGITSSDANIIATGTPAYIFSTRTSIDEFKNNYAIPKSKAAIESLQNETTQFSRINSIITALEEMETLKAIKVLEQMGIKETTNPRQELLKLFNTPKQIDPQNFDVEGLLYYLFQDEINSLDAKDMNDANVKFLKNVKNRQKKIGSSAKEINELVKKVTQTTFTNQLDAPEIAPVYEKFRKLLQNKDSIKDLNLISLIKTYKGTLQEMIDAAYILETFSTMNVKVNLIGAVKAALEKGDGLQSGSKMQGNSTNLTQSDIEVLIGNEKLGVSVKATVDVGTGENKGKSLKYSGTETIKPQKRTISEALYGLTTKDKGLEEAVKYALVVYASEFNMNKSNANYFIRDQVLRPLAFAETSRSSFIDLMFTAGLRQTDTKGEKFEPIAENYHYLLAVNGHYFWHSHLLKSAKEDLLNYNSDLYKSLLVTEDISSMSAISVMSSRLLYWKRKVLKKADPKKEKSYGDRLSILMQNDVMVDLLKQYSKALNSVSFKVNARAFRLGL